MVGANHTKKRGNEMRPFLKITTNDTISYLPLGDVKRIVIKKDFVAIGTTFEEYRYSDALRMDVLYDGLPTEIYR